MKVLVYVGKEREILSTSALYTGESRSGRTNVLLIPTLVTGRCESKWVQRIAIKMIQGLEKKVGWRLKELNLFRLLNKIKSMSTV